MSEIYTIIIYFSIRKIISLKCIKTKHEKKKKKKPNT